jgi:hypothetical protein
MHFATVTQKRQSLVNENYLGENRKKRAGRDSVICSLLLSILYYHINQHFFTMFDYAGAKSNIYSLFMC